MFRQITGDNDGTALEVALDDSPARPSPDVIFLLSSFLLHRMVGGSDSIVREDTAKHLLGSVYSKAVARKIFWVALSTRDMGLTSQLQPPTN